MQLATGVLAQCLDQHPLLAPESDTRRNRLTQGQALWTVDTTCSSFLFNAIDSFPCHHSVLGTLLLNVLQPDHQRNAGYKF